MDTPGYIIMCPALVLFPPSRPLSLRYHPQMLWGIYSVSSTNKSEFLLSLWIFWVLAQNQNICKETAECCLFTWTSENVESPDVKALKNLHLSGHSCTFNPLSVGVLLEGINFPFWNARRGYVYSTFITVQQTPFFLRIRNTGPENWSDYGSFTFTAPFLNFWLSSSTNKA